MTQATQRVLTVGWKLLYTYTDDDCDLQSVVEQLRDALLALEKEDHSAQS